MKAVARFWARPPRTRRAMLIWSVLAMLAMDIAYFGWWYWAHADVTWLLRMPQIEREQRNGPANMLFSSESWDPRIPPSSAIDPDFSPSRPSMLRDILACRPSQVVIDFDPGWSLQPAGVSFVEQAMLQMPHRYYVFAPRNDETMRPCLTRLAPEGYQVESAPSH